MPIKLGIVPVTPFEQNCSILVCQETGDAAVVDPGGDIEKILDGVKQMGGNVMHLNMMGAEELNTKLENTHELTKDTMLEKVVLITSAYFCIATEICFILN